MARHRQDDAHFRDLEHAEHGRDAAAHGLTAEPPPAPLRWWTFKDMATGEPVGVWHIRQPILWTRRGGITAVATWKDALAEVVWLEGLKA
jgi:hypothetical protein